jgi:uncharacterized surface protein with fasciclin (FAS1) repeats
VALFSGFSSSSTVPATVEGGKLWATMQGNHIVLKHEKGGTATVTIADVFQSNGVIRVIDAVLMP